MRKLIMALVFTLLHIPAALSLDEVAALDLARQSAQRLGSELQARLQFAMGERGVVGAIDVCRLEAPAIAGAVAGDVAAPGPGPVEVGRTALRLRNPANLPDRWGVQQLQDFRRRQATGEALAGMEVHRIEDGPGGRELRYMRAIPTAAGCLACHGSELAPEVGRTLLRHYPADAARGFAPGDLRGAFKVRLPLESR